MSAKRRWRELGHSERRDAVHVACRRGRTLKSLASYLDASEHDVEPHLEALRAAGLVLCTNKIWYRKDIPLRPAEPRAPRVTPKMEKFLAKQGNLF